MQPGYPGQDPYEQQPSSPYPNDYSQPSSPQEYSLYPPAPQQPPYPQSAPPYPQSVPPAYPPAGYSVPPQQTQSNLNVFGLLSMILGILSIPLLFCCYLGVPLAIAAIVLGIIGVSRAGAGSALAPGRAVTGRGMAIGGIACGVGCFLVLFILIVASVSLGNTHY
jgi:hypothetical protein